MTSRPFTAPGTVEWGAEGPTQERFEFDTYGFVVLPEVLDGQTAARLAERLSELDRLHGTDYVYDGAHARHVKSVFEHDDELLGLIDHPRVLALVEEILGPEVILGSLNARIVRPGDPEQPFHSDIPAPLRRSGTPIMLNAVWMLDAFTTENGATRFVPGGHLLAEADPPKDRAYPHVLQPVGPPGSVLVFSGQCWHGGGANRTDRVRRAVFAHYRIGHWMRFAVDPVRHITPERWVGLTERQRRLLRMEQGVDQPTAADYY
jgi:ectoine hydroxylase-related dioxygenase (phytanoyl-CoA dioxygenase family)